MISVDEALRHVLDHAQARPSRPTELAQCAGLILDEDVTSTVDSPPYDKSIVDGYAVVAEELRGGTARLAILEEVIAGTVPRCTVTRGTATRVMTGAPIPAGADAVVMIERTQLAPQAAHSAGENSLGVVEIRDDNISSGRNILRRAAAMRTGDVVLRRGARLRPLEIALLAEIGCATVRAIPRPRVAILPTGNELVEPHEMPAAGQIRNSNGPMLAATVRLAGGDSWSLPIARDDVAQLRERIAAGLTADVLLLSGGVSAGVMDLVPGVLVELGAREVFHKVRVKPGKPIWFGTYRGAEHETLIFGLPGNPVSTYVCSELFVRPAIDRLRGGSGRGLRQARAVLTAEHRQRGDRPTYFPAVYDAASAEVRPVAWQGSADLRGLSAANALALFPPGDHLFQPGEKLDVLLLDG